MDNKEKLFLVKYAGTLPGNPIDQQVHNATPNIMSSGNLPGKPIPSNYAPHDPFQPGGAKVQTFSQNPKPNALPPAPNVDYGKHGPDGAFNMLPPGMGVSGMVDHAMGSSTTSQTTSTTANPTPSPSSGPYPGTPEFYQQKKQENDSMLSQDQINKRIQKFPNGRLAQQHGTAPAQQPNAPQTGNTPDAEMPYYNGGWSG